MEKLKMKLGYGLFLFFPTLVVAQVDPQQFLYRQIDIGEKLHNDTLVLQSLQKLELMQPNSPKLLLGWVAYHSKAHHIKQANENLVKLKTQYPQSPEYLQAKNLIALNTSNVQQQLKQARTLANEHKLSEAVAVYQKLFSDQPPHHMALEYWTILAYYPVSREKALLHLNDIDGGQAVIQDIHKITMPTSVSSNSSQTTAMTPYWDLVKRGNSALKNQQFSLAKTYFSQAHALNKDDKIASQALHQIQQQKQRIELQQLQQKAKRQQSMGQVNVLIQTQRRIIELNPQEVWSTYDLAMTYAKSNQILQADQLFQKNFRQTYAYALYLFNTKRYDKAHVALQRVTPTKERTALLSQIQDAQTLQKLLLQQEQLKASGNLLKLIEVQQKICELQPNQIWAIYNLASSYIDNQQFGRADNLFDNPLAKKLPDYYQAYAQYLFNAKRFNQALTELNHIQIKDEKYTQLLQAIKIEQTYVSANMLWQQQQDQTAIQTLKQLPPSLRRDLQLANWSHSLKDDVVAKQYYFNVLKLDVANVDAQFGLIEIYTPVDQKKAIALAQNLSVNQLSLSQQVRMAQLLNQLGLKQKADDLYRTLAKRPLETPSQMQAQLKHQLAEWTLEQDKPQEALNLWKEALYSSELISSTDVTDDDFTKAMRSNNSDTDLQKDIKTQASAVYRQQNVEITLGTAYSQYNGESGSSKLSERTAIAQTKFPLKLGTAFVQIDKMQLDAGHFKNISPNWRSCTNTQCQLSHQKNDMTVYGFGWKNQNWDIDFGTFTNNIAQNQLVGGVGYHNILNEYHYTLSAERRAITSSLLSFVGTTDAKTQKQWGSIHSDSLKVALSKPFTTNDGFWVNTDVAQLNGKNVDTNTRLRVNGGYYSNFTLQPHQKLTLGLNTTIMHFAKDMSGYTFGQGGYYSPQQFYGISVPIKWAGSTENFAWNVDTTLGYSIAKTKKTTTGLGYGMQLNGEYRLSPHFALGGVINLKHQKDYSPSTGLLYIRYLFKPWNGDVISPPKAPSVYLNE